MVNECVPTHVVAQEGAKIKPKWMTQRVMETIKKKEVAWERFHKRRKITRHRMYCRARNLATRAVQDAKYRFENFLAHEVKDNPQAFFAYTHNKTRIKEPVSRVGRPDGTLTESIHETCEVFNRIS